MTSVTEPNKALHGIEKLVSTVAAKEGFRNFKLEITPVNTHGANFTGALYFVDVVEDHKYTLKLFSKANVIPEHAQTLFNANRIYTQEVLIYTELADSYHELQERYGVPEHKKFKFPKYYGSNLSNLEEVIIFENLQAQGFILHDRFKPLDWEYAKAGVEELAKFHALSFALEKDSPELFDKLIKNNKGGIDRTNLESFKEVTNQLMLQNIAVVDSEHRSKIEKFLNENKDGIWINHFEPISKYSTLVHGDYRISNILLKYQGNFVTSLKPVDYQTSYYGCPLTDLMYFLFSGTDEEFRRLHFEQIIEHYHNSLADHLKLLSRDINDIYPKSTFYFELKDKLPFGLELAICFLSMIFVDPKAGMKVEDFTNADAMTEKLPIGSKIYSERLNGIVRDFVRWGFLN